MIHPVVSSFIDFCFISNDSFLDPSAWPEFQEQIQSSKILSTVAQELTAFQLSSSSSSATTTHSPLIETAAKQQAVVKRVIVARTLFRSLLQPIVSNLLVAAFKSHAMRLFFNTNTTTTTNNESILQKSQLQSISAALVPISTIKTSNSLLQLVSAHPQYLQKEVIEEFMKSAGFHLLQTTPVESWQWEGCNVISSLLENTTYEETSSSSSSSLLPLYNKMHDALKKLKQTEEQILSPLEKMFNERGGLFTVDRIATLTFKQLSDIKSTVVEKEFTSISSSSSENKEQREEREQDSFTIVSQVLAAKNAAREKAQLEETQKRLEEAKLRAQQEVEADRRNKLAEQARREKEESEHKRKVESVQHLMQRARKTLHETGRVRNSSFGGVKFVLQPLNVATRIHVCYSKQNQQQQQSHQHHVKTQQNTTTTTTTENDSTSPSLLCDDETGLEIHWHLRAAPNVIYAFTAHLTSDAQTLVHLGDEIGYQYGTVPGMPHFGKTVMMNRKMVDGNGKLEKIVTDDVKEVKTCVCGMSFDELWQ
jgi:hypothetical protein